MSVLYGSYAASYFTQTPVIVENPDCSEIDLVSANSHLLHSEVCVYHACI